MIDRFTDEYFFLSNFYESKVTFEGITYLNNEAAFQAMKTLDESERRSFAGLDPDSAKRAGRKVSLRSDWEEVKTDLMYEICKAKFTQNKDLAEKASGNGWRRTR